jgi:hypothetical protein
VKSDGALALVGAEEIDALSRPAGAVQALVDVDARAARADQIKMFSNLLNFFQVYETEASQPYIKYVLLRSVAVHRNTSYYVVLRLKHVVQIK